MSQRLSLPFDTVGEVELLSLHRIRSRIPTLDVHPVTRGYLVGELMEENRQYREDAGHNRYCITPDHLDSAVETTMGYLRDNTAAALASMRDPLQATPADVILRLEEITSQALETQDKKMREWFVDNYDSLIYDTNGNIPFAVVMALRGQLQAWAFQRINPFTNPMTDVIEGIVKGKGLDPEKFEDHMDMWKYLKTLPRE